MKKLGCQCQCQYRYLVENLVLETAEDAVDLEADCMADRLEF